MRRGTDGFKFHGAAYRASRFQVSGSCLPQQRHQFPGRDASLHGRHIERRSPGAFGIAVTVPNRGQDRATLPDRDRESPWPAHPAAATRLDQGAPAEETSRKGGTITVTVPDRAKFRVTFRLTSLATVIESSVTDRTVAVFGRKAR